MPHNSRSWVEGSGLKVNKPRTHLWPVSGLLSACPAWQQASGQSMMVHQHGMRTSQAQGAHHSGPLTEQLQFGFPHARMAVRGVPPPQQREQHQGVQGQAVEEHPQPRLPAQAGCLGKDSMVSSLNSSHDR